MKKTGTYIAAWFDDQTCREIGKFFKDLPKPNFKYHITIIYDTNTECDKTLAVKIPPTGMVKFTDLKIIKEPNNKRFLISELESQYIDDMFDYLTKELGYTHSHRELLKHITIGEVSKDFKLNFKNPLKDRLFYLDYIKTEPIIKQE